MVGVNEYVDCFGFRCYLRLFIFVPSQRYPLTEYKLVKLINSGQVSDDPSSTSESKGLQRKDNTEWSLPKPSPISLIYTKTIQYFQEF